MLPPPQPLLQDTRMSFGDPTETKQNTNCIVLSMGRLLTAPVVFEDVTTDAFRLCSYAGDIIYGVCFVIVCSSSHLLVPPRYYLWCISSLFVCRWYHIWCLFWHFGTSERQYFVIVAFPLYLYLNFCESRIYPWEGFGVLDKSKAWWVDLWQTLRSK